MSHTFKWSSATLLSQNTNTATHALEYVADELEQPGKDKDELAALLKVLYTRLEQETDNDMLELILYAIEQAYYHQIPLDVSIAPLKRLVTHSREEFVERALHLIYFSQQRAHFDAFHMALQAESETVRKKAQEVVEALKLTPQDLELSAP